MKVPCQAAIWYLLPAIGAGLAREMKKLGMTQKKIASRLGVTPATVSHYLKRKRGSDLKLGRAALSEIRKLAKDLASEKKSGTGMVMGICTICSIARKEGVLCKFHTGASKGHKCSLCMGKSVIC